MIEKIKKFVSDNSWMELEDEGTSTLYFSTRENSNVGDEEPGEKDITMVEQLTVKLLDTFPDAIDFIEDEVVDEWVHINVYLKT